MVTEGSPRTARPALKAAVAAVLAAVALGGCAQSIAGTPTANEAQAAEVRAQQQLVRDCETARVDLTKSLTDALRRAQSDFAAGTSELTKAVSAGTLSNFERRCGPELFAPAYSQMLVDLQQLQLTGSSATILRSSLLRAFCTADGKKVTLTPEAKRACNAAR